MSKLLKDINKFFKEYDQTHMFETVKFTKDDMYDHNALMTAYENIWETMGYYEDCGSAEYKWISALYEKLGNYIDVFENGKKHNYKFLAIFKLCVSVFCTACVGAFIAVMVAYGFDIMAMVGILMAVFCAIGSGVGAYEDLKEVTTNANTCR